MSSAKRLQKKVTFEDFQLSESNTLNVQRQGLKSFEGLNDSHASLQVLFCRLTFSIYITSSYYI